MKTLTLSCAALMIACAPITSETVRLQRADDAVIAGDYKAALEEVVLARHEHGETKGSSVRLETIVQLLAGAPVTTSNYFREICLQGDADACRQHVFLDAGRLPSEPETVVAKETPQVNLTDAAPAAPKRPPEEPPSPQTPCGSLSLEECTAQATVILRDAQDQTTVNTGLSQLTFSCEKGHTLACATLGDLMLAGGETERGVQFQQQACDGGYLQSCVMLGSLYATGDVLPKDPSRSVALFTTACEGGLETACGSLSYLYASGTGIAQDFSAARQYAQIGCDAGQDLGCKVLANLPSPTQGE